MSLLARAGLYYRTVRHLRARQLWTRVARRLVAPRVGPGSPPVRRAVSDSPRRPVERGARWVAPGRVRIHDIERSFDGRVDWAPEEAPRLWAYELNYFSDLPESAWDPARRWMSDVVELWIDANPPVTPVSWDPYPVSLRLINWTKWILLSEAEGGDTVASDRVVASLALQARLLERRLEFDISANHLFANAAALATCGLFFAGPEGDRWAERGFALLEREIDEQVLDDGGHYERSPMYHAVVLEQIIDVLNLLVAFGSAAPDAARGARDLLSTTALSMLDWLAAMTHPDGGIAFFHDATLGSAPSCDELFDYANRMGLKPERPFLEGVQWLERTDYFRLTSDDGRTVAFLDAGGVAPEHQPGHAHCSALSVELSRDGARVLVNSGTSTYEEGPARSIQRATTAHNTVRIDGEEQSEMWGSHRVGRRAGLVHAGRSGDSVFAVHDGYARLPGRPEHARTMEMGENTVAIVDEIDGAGHHLVEWFFHLHPDVAAEVRPEESPARVELSRGGSALGAMSFPDGVAVSVDGGTWHPGFNVCVPNRHVRAVWRGPLPAAFRVAIDWA